MKYKIELDLPENKLALALEFLKSLSFVKNVKSLTPNIIPNEVKPESTVPNQKSYTNSQEKRGGYGVFKGLINVPADFNEPLDDLKDYM